MDFAAIIPSWKPYPASRNKMEIIHRKWPDESHVASKIKMSTSSHHLSLASEKQ